MSGIPPDTMTIIQNISTFMQALDNCFVNNAKPRTHGCTSLYINNH